MEDGAKGPEVLSKLKSSLDLTHACGYVTLLDLPHRDDDGGGGDSALRGASPGPRNGKVGKEQADLLEAELDSIEESDREKRIRRMKLEVGGSKEAGTSRRKSTANWTLLDVNFGVPLFDAKLNKEVCQRIVSCALWKRDR